MIKMLTSIAGDDFAFKPNEETNYFSDAQEKSLIADGLAENVAAKVTKKVSKKVVKKVK